MAVGASPTNVTVPACWGQNQAGQTNAPGTLILMPVGPCGEVFFAVVSEAFFERPAALKRKHPQLYEELQLFYRQDPLGFASRA